MDPFDEENHEKKKNPHDPFRGDDDIFRDIFNDDKIRDIFNDNKIMDDIKQMAEEMMKMFTNRRQRRNFINSLE